MSSSKKQPKYLVANWKSNPISVKEIEKLQKGYSSFKIGKNTKLIVCPSPLHQLLDFSKGILVGAQGVSVAHTGTGLWSVDMLMGLSVSHCIVGHSEQRSVGETDIDVHNKVVGLVEKGIIPIICIGESMRDDNGKYINILRHQLKVVFSGMNVGQAGRVLIAYEPVWAIGARAMRPCLPGECYEAVHIIREEVSRIVPGVLPEHVVVLYGGSVDSSNADSYISEGAADGFIIGRASLDIPQMKDIVKILDAY